MQVVETIGFFQLQKGKSFFEVALNGTQADVEFFSKRLRVELVALVQFFQYLDQTVTEGVVIRCFDRGHFGWP